MRRHATDVLSSTSRLLKSSASALKPMQPPAYYQAALANPPPILPARKVVRQAQGKKQGLQKIVYEEDRIRRQFFKDFPFEALRPTSLVEGFDIKSEHDVAGETWTVLSQRGGYPTVENTIAYVLNLHQYHSHSLSSAYAAATAQFISLRAKYEVATIASQAEHQYYGAKPPLSPFKRFQKIEERALDTLNTANRTVRSEPDAPSKKNRPWTATVDPSAKPQVLQAIEDLDLARGYFKAWGTPMPVEDVPAVEAVKETAETVGATMEERVAEPAAV